ncbi:peptidoglycan-binding protein [Patescibacteria group bacterium]|nr:peptidoglycan-binding protein [Patescibacteria group bacterium]
MTLKNTFAKVASVAVAASLVVGVATFGATANAAALTSAQVQSIISLLQSFGADATTIANVQASLTGSAPSVPSTPSTPASCSFTRDLTIGATGADVTALQQRLIANGYSIAAGATGRFGSQTQAAVKAWQTASGITPAAGYFGARSRSALCAGGTVTTPTTPVAGTGLTVSAGASIANALAPQGASRVPFTNFSVTAGTDGDVTVNSVTVQRVGSAQNASFAGVILVDLDTGMQVGTSKTFNSNNQTNVGAPMVVKAGTTKRFQIAGNMNSSLSSYAGEVPGISVIGVNTSAAVSGSLPITGAFHTINATLTVGSLTLASSNAFASNANASKEIGTTGQRVTGFRLTAGSAEDVRLKTLTFNQTGSVSANDLANVMVMVGTQSYPMTVSADGKYYTASLGSGLVIAKGNQVDVYVTYDIVGSNSSGRTVIFDVDKNTDIFGTGEIYGYGISPAVGSSAVPTSRGTFTITSGTPFIYATQVSVTGASATTITKANEVPAQNIAINVPNQPLGGYIVDLKGEDMTVASSVFTIASTTGSGTGLLTNLTIVDGNGAVVAGPVDAVYTNSTTQTVTFTDTITYKVGRGVYTLRGKVASTIGGNGTYVVSTNPSTGWTTVKGVTTGNTISLSSYGSFSLNTMTVKAGALVIGPAASPASQTITPGGSSVLLSNFQFDASQSGEDVRISSLPARLTFATGAATELTSCAIFDGSTQLSTGSNVVNPSGTSPSDNTFTLDNPVTILKGTVKTLGLRCNVSGSATNNATFAWAPGAAAFTTNFTVTGATSGTSVTPTASSGTAPTFTIGTGSVTVTTDASSPSYQLAAANSTGVTNVAIKFRATNEDVNLQKVGLQLTNTASSSASDLVKVSLWDGATKVGEATFLSGSTVATSTLTSTVLLTKNSDKVLTVKADYGAIGTGEAVTFSGRLVAIDYRNAEGTGAQSGTTIFPSGSSASAGTRVMKSFPTVSVAGTINGSTGLADGRLMQFKVTADAAGPIGITQFALNLATTTASVTNVNILGFTDSGFSTPVSGVTADGSLEATANAVPGTGNVIVNVQTSGGTATAIQVPAGGTRFFEVRGSVSGTATGAAVTTKLLGSSSFPSTSATVNQNPLLAASATGVSASDAVFVWSPNSTTTATRSDQDWTNGYGVTGLPAGGLFATRSH